MAARLFTHLSTRLATCMDAIDCHSLDAKLPLLDTDNLKSGNSFSALKSHWVHERASQPFALSYNRQRSFWFTISKLQPPVVIRMHTDIGIQALYYRHPAERQRM